MGIAAGLPRDNATYRRILDAASEEFALHGFAGARIRAIVDAARVNLAAVNYYFGGKEGLYRQTLERLSTRAAGAFRRPAERRGRSPGHRLHRTVFALLEGLSQDRSASILGRILAHEAMDPTPHFDLAIAQLTRPELEGLREAVRELAGPGVAEDEVNLTTIGIVGQCLLFLFGRSAIERMLPGITAGPHARHRHARHIADFAVAGILALSKPPKATAGVRRGLRLK